jgi:hypothetical protein
MKDLPCPIVLTDSHSLFTQKLAEYAQILSEPHLLSDEQGQQYRSQINQMIDSVFDQS